MSYFIQPVITNKAIAEVASAIQSNQTLRFTRLALGTGKQVGDIKTITDLANPWKNLDVSVTTVDNTFKVLSRLNNNELTQEKHVTELGLFAKIGTSPEFLYLYTSADQGDLVPDNSQGAYVRTYFLETTISNDGTLDVEYVTGSNTFATKEEVNQKTLLVVNHGSDGNMVRPQEAIAVYWTGTVEPVNALDNDLWIGG